jgi:hypothetical protein
VADQRVQRSGHDVALQDHSCQGTDVVSLYASVSNAGGPRRPTNIRCRTVHPSQSPWSSAPPNAEILDDVQNLGRCLSAGNTLPKPRLCGFFLLETGAYN